MHEVKGLYEGKFGHDLDEYVKQDGMKFHVTHGAPPSLAQLEARVD